MLGDRENSASLNVIVQVSYFVRHPVKGAYSVENVFESIKSRLPANILATWYTNQYLSTGIWGRLADALRATKLQGDVNHVTGDVHYLTYFLNRGRTILTILDCIALQRARGLKFWLLWLLWFWLPEKRCTAITVISESTRQQLIAYLGCRPEKIKVIHCNISDEFKAAPKEFNISCPRILHIGTKENKNLERHVMALVGIDCVLVVIGTLTNSQKKILTECNIQYENLVNLSQSELVDQYRSSDLLLFVSTYEGFGLPIVEAQAIGRPVITSNLWSMPEVAGSAACLVDPMDVNSIRSGVKRVLEDSLYRESLIQMGWKNVTRFRTSNIANEYAQLYKSIYEKNH